MSIQISEAAVIIKQQFSAELISVKKLSKIKNIIPVVKKQVVLISRELEHWYENGLMYSKHIIRLALGNIFRCSDRELPDELRSRDLLKVFWIQKSARSFDILKGKK